MAESILPSGDGKILVLHDITSAQRMKEELGRSQRLAAMGEMAASLAHQLRTPLAAALLYTANLGQPGVNEAARLKFSEKAASQLKRLERLIQDVLLTPVVRASGGTSCPQEICWQRCGRPWNPWRVRKGSSLWSMMPVRGRNRGESQGVGGALVNLLENALQATPAGGKIYLGGKICPAGVVFPVRDGGPGVPMKSGSASLSLFLPPKGREPVSGWRLPAVWPGRTVVRSSCRRRPGQPGWRTGTHRGRNL